MPLQKLDRPGEIVVALIAVFERALPEAAVVGVAAAVGENDRQRDLAFAEIVADRFSEQGLLAGIIERIVHQLEGDAEIATEGFKRGLFVLRPLGDNRADLGRRGKQRCRFGV